MTHPNLYYSFPGHLDFSCSIIIKLYICGFVYLETVSPITFPEGRVSVWMAHSTVLSACCCSVAWSCPTLCNSMDWSMPGFPENHIFLREIWKKTNKNPKNKALWGKTIKILQQKQTKLMEVWKMKLRQFPRKWSLETRWEKSKIRGSGPHRNLKRREPWSEREELPLRSSG